QRHRGLRRQRRHRGTRPTNPRDGLPECDPLQPVGPRRESRLRRLGAAINMPDQTRALITPDQITSALATLGIRPGDWIFAHTALRSFGAPIERGADGLIDALIAAVSPGDTVAVPAHAPSGPEIFDPRSSPLEDDLGVTPRVFVARADAVRSCHPTHSAAAIGPDARAWMSDHERCRATSAGSPLDKLRRHPQGK